MASRCGNPCLEPTLLIAGAFLPEVDHLVEWAEQSGSRFIIAGESAIKIEVAPLGIGNLNAALGLRDTIDRLHSEGSALCELIFLGSAGVEPHHAELIGSMVAVESVASRELATLRGESKSLDFAVPPFILAPGLIGSALMQHSTATAVLPSRVDCNAPNALSLQWPDDASRLLAEVLTASRDPAHRHYRPKLPWVENLELYGIARVAAAQSPPLPVSALLALTNSVDAEGSRAWHENHRRLSDLLQLRVRHFFEQIAAKKSGVG